MKGEGRGGEGELPRVDDQRDGEDGGAVAKLTLFVDMAGNQLGGGELDYGGCSARTISNGASLGMTASG